eukprot:jgi/Botrbrau1/22388/Bobra.0801s0001.1
MKGPVATRTESIRSGMECESIYIPLRHQFPGPKVPPQSSGAPCGRSKTDQVDSFKRCGVENYISLCRWKFFCRQLPWTDECSAALASAVSLVSYQTSALVRWLW